MRPAEVKRELGKGVRLIDVRTPAEFASGHIAGSVNVPLDLVQRESARLAPAVPRGSVIVCRSGQRARMAAGFLPGSRVLAGGVLAWEDAGMPVKQGRPKWAMERQVRFAAGGLVLLFVLASVFWAPAKWLAAAIGAGLVFAALTNTCAMGALISKLPHNRGPRVTVDAALAGLEAR